MLIDVALLAVDSQHALPDPPCPGHRRLKNTCSGMSCAATISGPPSPKTASRSSAEQLIEA